MKKVLLIDVDSKIPNLALMQISAWHKQQGDKVGWEIKNPDVVYISCVFTRNKNTALGKIKSFKDAEVHVGGSGVSFDWLPEEMQKIKPDYYLYKEMNYSMGFTTRGCIRRCPFCIVRKKEGKYRRWQHIKEFHDPRFDTVELLDNNWYADKEWFFDNSQWLIDNEVVVVVEQGMDIRILTDEIAEQLSKLKFGRPLHFAWDNMEDEESLIEGLEMLKNAGINIRSNVSIYVLVDFDTTIEQDIYRCEALKGWDVRAYVMPYEQIDETYPEKLNLPHVKHLERWANCKRPCFYWAMDFWEYVELINPTEKIKIISNLEENKKTRQMKLEILK